MWPGDPSLEIRRFLDMGRGDAVNASSLRCSVHAGTHVDAPVHHVAGGVGADELPLEALIGPAVVADLTARREIGPADLDRLGLSADTKRLLFKTDNSEIWSHEPEEFRREFVALTTSAAGWIVRAGIRLVGIDYLSVERFGASPPLVHRTLLEAGVVILEGLDLRGVRAGRYQLICLPLKLRGLDGAPARAVLVEKGKDAK